VFGSAFSIREQRLRAVTSTFGLVLQQQVAWRDRLFVTAGLRRDATTRFHVDDPAAVYPSLGLSWRGPVPSGGFPLTSWRLRAAYGAASLVERPDVAWSVGLSAWGNRNRVAMSGLVSTVVFTGGGGLLQIAESGLPLGSYAGNPILGYADANGDGLVSPNEVDVGAGRGFLGTPFPTQGASLSSALTLRRRFRIAGL